MPRLLLAALAAALALPASAQSIDAWTIPPGAGQPNDLTRVGEVDDDGTIYVGGDFGVIGAVSTPRFGIIDPVTGGSTDLGLNITGGAVVYDVLAASNGDIYVGGIFSNIDGVAVDDLARWNASANGGNGAWESPGGVTFGGNSGVFALAEAPDGSIYVGGGFSGVNGQNNWGGLVRWDPSANGGAGAWNRVGVGLSPVVDALHVATDGTLLVGGSFAGANQPGGGSVLSYGILRWDPIDEVWTGFGQGVGNGSFFTQVYTITEDASGRVYIGGDFQTAGSTSASNVAVWDPSSIAGWAPLGAGTDDFVRGLGILPDGRIVVGGDFATAGGVASEVVAIWNPRSESWSNVTGLTPGVNATVHDIEVLPTGSFYAFGDDLRPMGDPISRRVLRWDFAVEQDAVADAAGWRLLGVHGLGATVDDLADLNLVQGIGAGTPAADFPAQYPAQAPNLFMGYGGGGATDYVAATATDETLTPGRGFWWYLFDSAFGPFNGGTSVSYDLSGFALSVDAPALPATQTVTVTDNADPGDDDWHMLGNPFNAPFAVDGISTDGGVLAGGVVSAYQPGTGYQILFAANPANAGEPDVAAVWQGFFGELIPNTSGGTVDVTYELGAVVPAATATFYGRTARNRATPYLHIRLAGQTTDGAPFADEAAYVRFLPEADASWDLHDTSKLTPPGGPYALVAPVTERDGTPYRLSLDSRPVAPASVPLAFTATDAASVTLTWDGAASLPADWTATLTDHSTGAVVDLRTEAGYTFATDAADWSERFLLTFASATSDDGAPEAGGPTLSVPYPNPASGLATLSLLGAEGRATVHLYDALGRRVATLLDRDIAAGAAVPLVVETAHLAPGAYVVRAATGTAVLSRSLTVVR